MITIATRDGCNVVLNVSTGGKIDTWVMYVFAMSMFKLAGCLVHKHSLE